MAKRLAADAAVVNGELHGPGGGDAAKPFPQLCSWLLDSVYEDGTKKGKTRLQIERRGEQVECVLKDADSGLCLTARHETLSDAVLTMELLLASDDCPWQLDPWPLRTPTVKRKK